MASGRSTGSPARSLPASGCGRDRDRGSFDLRCRDDRDDPLAGRTLTTVRLVSTEVTTTDPINDQPDFETVEIDGIIHRV